MTSTTYVGFEKKNTMGFEAVSKT